MKQNSEVFTVIQPDLCVICDPAKLDEHGCNGAPDWIIEILSPGNSTREMKIKYELYEETGVQEYWIVQPEYECIEQLVLDGATGKTPPNRSIRQGRDGRTRMLPRSTH